MRDYYKNIKPGSFFLVLIIGVFLFSSCGSSDTSQENSNANSASARTPATSGSNVTPLASPTPAATAQPSPSPSASAKPSPSVSPSPSKTTESNVKYYSSTGVVTKINMDLGSVELNHQDIPGLMPAMIMEFYVKDKQMLVPLKVGDKVSFTIEEKDHTEVISAIKKQ